MSDTFAYSIYAILHELNGREFKKKLNGYHEEMHYLMILANSILGAENARRINETPEAVVKDSSQFVSKLLNVTDPEHEKNLTGILEEFLIETLKDELRFCCPNCVNFNTCLDIKNLAIGELFKRRVEGEENEGLKNEIRSSIDEALEKTPFLNSNDAQDQCKDFIHQYDVSSLGNVIGRYRDIASELQKKFDLNYNEVQQKMIEINMEFCRKIEGINGDALSR
ncbi:MAG: hypothetical protein V3V59_04640 [Thermodesulfovibrionales bacterium]